MVGIGGRGRRWWWRDWFLMLILAGLIDHADTASAASDIGVVNVIGCLALSSVSGLSIQCG